MKRAVVLGAAVLVLAGAGIGGFLWYRTTTGYWIGVLNDPGKATSHKQALEALTYRREPGVEEALIAAIEAEPDAYRRVEIAEVLGLVGDGRAAPALAEALLRGIITLT